jgi:hypothetical protein
LVMETGRRDQQVEVTDRPPLLTKSPALAPEDPAYLIIDGKHRQTGKELLQGGLAADSVTRVVDTLVQPGKRDDAHGQARWPQLSQPRP